MKKESRPYSFLTKLILLLNFFAILALLFSYLSVYINPNTIAYLAFAGLAYPFILLVNLGFIVLWLFVKPRFLLMSLVFILLGWNHFTRLIQFNSSADVPDSVKKIKVLSYNTQNFHKVNASNTKYITDFSNQQNIFNFISEEEADIVCLQEILYDKEDYLAFSDQLGKKIHCPNNYHLNYFEGMNGKIEGMAIFTKFPIIYKGQLKYRDKTIGLFADLIIDSDTIRLYNLHLASIHFRKEDYHFFSEMNSNQDQEVLKQNSLKIIAKMQNAFIKRGFQTKFIKRHIKQSPYPIVVCGDFNDTPSSYAYQQISSGLKDAFIQSGKGLGRTYAGENFPAFRIDYIFHDPKFSSTSFTRHEVNLSDHFPITTILIKE